MSARSSRVLQQVANQLRAGRHPLIVGNVGDIVLLQGEVVPLSDALVRQAQSAFEVVVRVNAADGIEVVKGDEAFNEMVPDPEAVDSGGGRPDRERRLRALTQRIDRRDPVASVRACLCQTDVTVAVIIDQADILLQDPAHHDEPDRERIANLQLGMRNAGRVGRYRNTCVLLAGDHSAVPTVLLTGSDDIGIVEVELPTRPERAAVLALVVQTMHGADDLEAEVLQRVVDELAVLTEGETLQHLESLAAFSRASRHSVAEPRSLVSRHRFGDRPDYWGELLPRLESCFQTLLSRVYGQDAAVAKAMGVLAAGALGMRLAGDEFSNEGQPRGLLWFVGGTGVGKTELAKAIAEAVFGDEEAYFRLDMSTFAQEHAAERLMGAPPGYVGFERGGELTNAVRQRPNSVVLLDEIEKAHPRVLDRFMSILDDGRVTDAQGRVTYFGETIIIATTNVGAPEVTQLIEQRGDDVSFEEIRAISEDAVRRNFIDIGRPELYGRIESGVVAFDMLRGSVIDLITEKIVTAAAFDNGPELDVDIESSCRFAQDLLADPDSRALGGRQVRNVFQQEFRRLAVWLARAQHTGAERIHVRFVGTGMMVSVDGDQEQAVE